MRHPLQLVGDARLQAQLDPYQRRLFPHATDYNPAEGFGVDKIVAAVEDASALLGVETDESYTLEVGAEHGATVNITAKTQVGFLRALETLSQLVSFDFDGGSYELKDLLPLRVRDAPRFPHRGVLIDSARHYLPISTIRALVPSLAYAKLNVLHWHVVDDNSFPLASRAWPGLPQDGAYLPSQRYTARDVMDLTSYAASFGVRVIPEFDMPGHTRSWGKSHPELFTTNCTGVFDVASPTLFDFLETALTDWVAGSAPMFIDSFLHLGGDEVNVKCWSTDGDKKLMQQLNITDPQGLYGYFVNRVSEIAQQKLRKQVVLWDEVAIANVIPKGAIVQNWHDAALTKKIVQQGHKAIFSPNGGYTHGWYLDGLAATWEAMYALDPAENLTASEAALVLGGEGCMWGETVDPSDIFSTVWPRLGAIAERLWSPMSDTQNLTEARERLEGFRCRLLERGTGSGLVGGSGRGPLPGPGACNQEGKPNLEKRERSEKGAPKRWIHHLGDGMAKPVFV